VVDDFKGIRITKGYSRDHRPELNQVILNLITKNQACIPVYMNAAVVIPMTQKHLRS